MTDYRLLCRYSAVKYCLELVYPICFQKTSVLLYRNFFFIEIQCNAVIGHGHIVRINLCAT